MTKPGKPRHIGLPNRTDAEASLTKWGIDFLTVREAVVSSDGSLFVADDAFGHVFEHDAQVSAQVVAALIVVGVAVKRD